MTSQKEKRGAIGAQRRRDLSLFVTELQKLQDEFPRIRLDIQYFINKAVGDIERTREGDRQMVLDSLTKWKAVGSTQNDLVEETGLSDRVVRGVLDELLQENPPLVVITGERSEPGQRGRPSKVYDLAR